MTLDFERAGKTENRFLVGGKLPETAEGFYALFKGAKDFTSDELAIFSDEVAGLEPKQLEQFCAKIVPMLDTEPLLAVVFHNPAVIRNMPRHVIEQVFSELYDKKYNCLIRKQFFEESLLNLAVHSPESLAHLRVFMGQHHKRGDRAEWFLTPAVDKAFARQIVARSHAGTSLDDQTRSRNQWISLCIFELPETLDAYIRAKIVAGDAVHLIPMVGEMAFKNLLSDKYIEITRSIVGDDFFLKACKRDLAAALSMSSTLQLTNLYGEAAVHDSEFLSGLQWTFPTGVPDYIKRFSAIGFNEEKLPLLAQYTLKRMNDILKNPPDGLRNTDFEVNFCAMAGRMGKGKAALHRLAQVLASHDDDIRQPSRIFEAILDRQSNPAVSLREKGAYKLLVKAIGKLGLETLQAVAPDVSGEFVADVLDSLAEPPSKCEIFRLFPHAKGRVLEFELGL